jgi:microcin C transport system ATP-binding protein
MLFKSRDFSSAPTVLSVRELSVRLHDRPDLPLILDRISLDIRAGETACLVGESGSGKSVTSLAVMGLLPKGALETAGGAIRLADTDLLAISPAEQRAMRARRMAMVFQEPMTALNPVMRVGDQIDEVLRTHTKMSQQERRARVIEIMDHVHLSDVKRIYGSYPHQLSGGQRQRVMIAMALANEPDLLIADEPTTALDVTVQAQILELLADLKKRLGMAMLFITHDLGIVRKVADRVCVMLQGKIVEAGPVADVFGNPQHEYTQRLLAAEPRGRPDKVPAGAPIVVEAGPIKVWFPIKRGFLGRTVGHVKAVDGVSVKVREGETVGVVGESGSGKTTLGLAMLRLISSEGPVVFLGNRIDGLKARQIRPFRKNMQVVFQDPYGSLSPRLSVTQIVEEGLLVLNKSMNADERREVVARALIDVGLDPSAMDRYPHEFSGGQRQRIAIARAMALEPQFVMLDEPTSALDMSVQSQIVDLLRELQKRRKLAYMFISHDLKVVRALANHVIVMQNGKVVEEGDADAVFSAPRTDYTRALFSAAFNLSASDHSIVSD